MKKLFLIGCLSLGLVACGKTSEPFNPQMKGEILTLSMTGKISGIYVEGEESEAYSITAASVTIDENTKLFNEDGKTVKFSDLEEGDSVEIEFEGSIAESYPVQGTAKAIRLLATN